MNSGSIGSASWVIWGLRCTREWDLRFWWGVLGVGLALDHRFDVNQPRPVPRDPPRLTRAGTEREWVKNSMARRSSGTPDPAWR